MEDKATLHEQLQQYEHTIMQLSGETETIGEYVSLYQTQRAALRSKFREKDMYIQQLLEEKASLEVCFHVRESAPPLFDPLNFTSSGKTERSAVINTTTESLRTSNTPGASCPSPPYPQQWQPARGREDYAHAGEGVGGSP